MREIRKALRPVRGRLRLIRLCKGAAWGACGAGLLCMLLLALSFVVPVRHRLPLCGALMAAGTLLTGLVNALRPIRWMTAAKAGDAHGLKERVQTALALSGGNAMEQMQREDALKALRDFEPSVIPLPVMKRQWLCAGVAVLLGAGLLLLPNPQDAVIARADAFEKRMEEAAAKADKAAGQQDEADLTDKQKQETRKLLSDLSRELRQAEKPMDAMLALGDAEKRLEALRDTMAGDQMRQLSSALDAQGMNALAEALESGDMQAMSDALEGINAEALEKAASELSGDMQELLNAAASALQSGALSTALSQLSQLSQAAQSLSASQLASLSQLLNSLRSSTGSMSAGSGMLGGNGGQPGGMSSSMNGSGNQAGSGAGTGSTNEDQTSDVPDAAGMRGSNDPRYREGQYESIYDPTRLDVSQTEIAAQSPQGEGESMQLQLGPGAGTFSGSIPYNQVALEYADAAARAADSQNLTQQERQWVTDYFTALTEE